MSMLPYERHTYSSSLPPGMLIERLMEAVQPERPFSIRLFNNRPARPYEGMIEGYSFRIHRIFGYRNSFLPMISGTIQAMDNGSLITVRIRLHLFVAIFMGLWMGIIGLVFLAGALSLLRGNLDLLGMFAMSSMMLLFGYGLSTGVFKYESSRSRKDLERLLEASLLPKNTAIP